MLLITWKVLEGRAVRPSVCMLVPPVRLDRESTVDSDAPTPTRHIKWHGDVGTVTRSVHSFACESTNSPIERFRVAIKHSIKETMSDLSQLSLRSMSRDRDESHNFVTDPWQGSGFGAKNVSVKETDLSRWSQLSDFQSEWNIFVQLWRCYTIVVCVDHYISMYVFLTPITDIYIYIVLLGDLNVNRFIIVKNRW